MIEQSRDLSLGGTRSRVKGAIHSKNIGSAKQLVCLFFPQDRSHLGDLELITKPGNAVLTKARPRRLQDHGSQVTASQTRVKD